MVTLSWPHCDPVTGPQPHLLNAWCLGSLYLTPAPLDHSYSSARLTTWSTLWVMCGLASGSSCWWCWWWPSRGQFSGPLISRYTQEIFAFLISLIFIYETFTSWSR